MLGAQFLNTGDIILERVDGFNFKCGHFAGLR